MEFLEGLQGRLSWRKLMALSAGGSTVLLGVMWHRRSSERATGSSRDAFKGRQGGDTSLGAILRPNRIDLIFCGSVAALAGLHCAAGQAEHASTAIIMGGAALLLRTLDSIPGLEQGVSVGSSKAARLVLSNTANGRVMVGRFLGNAVSAATTAYLVRKVGLDFATMLTVDAIAALPLAADVVWPTAGRLWRIERFVDDAVMSELPAFVEGIAAARGDVVAEAAALFDATWNATPGLGPAALDATCAELMLLLELMCGAELRRALERTLRPRAVAALPGPLVAMLGEHALALVDHLAVRAVHANSLGGAFQALVDEMLKANRLEVGPDGSIAKRVAREYWCSRLIGQRFDQMIASLRMTASHDSILRDYVHQVVAKVANISAAESWGHFINYFASY